MQRILWSFCGAVLLLCQAASVFGQTLRIAVDSNYPPYAWQDKDKKLYGTDVIIAKALCDTLNTQCHLIAVPWQVILKGLLTDSYDAAIGNIPITKTPQHQIDFSIPYMQVLPQFVARGDVPYSFAIDTIKKHSVGVLRNSAPAVFLQEEYPHIALKRYFNLKTMLADFHAKKTDYLFIDPAVLQHHSGQETYRFSGTILCDQNYFSLGQGIAFKKDNTKLRLQLDFAINQLSKSGQLQAILDAHLGKNIATAHPSPCANTAQTGA